MTYLNLIVELIFMAVLCFRLLQFHQTLVGLEVSFVICLLVYFCHIVNYIYFSLCGEDTIWLQGLPFP